MPRDNRPLMLNLKSGYFSRTMDTFRDALVHVVDTKIKSLRSIAAEAGVSYEQLKKVKQGKTQNTNIEDARRDAGVFGQAVEEFILSPAGSTRDDLNAVLQLLAPQEREILLYAAKAQIASRAQLQPQSSEDP